MNYDVFLVCMGTGLYLFQFFQIIKLGSLLKVCRERIAFESSLLFEARCKIRDLGAQIDDLHLKVVSMQKTDEGKDPLVK